VFAIGILMVSLFFILRGYKVPLLYLCLPLLFAICLLLIRFCYYHYNKHDAAKFADRFFDLKESLSTALDFERKSLSIGFHALQKDYTTKLSSGLDIGRIKLELPSRLLYSGLLVCALTMWLCTFDNADFIKQKQKQEQVNLEKSGLINKHLEKTFKDLNDQLLKEEKELLNKTRLPKLLKNLKLTKDRKEALKQYAKLEKELRKLTERSKMAQDEKMLAEIAKKLLKNKTLRDMGRQLSKKEYKKAADSLSKMKMKGQPLSKENQSNRKKLNKLAERMKDATSNYKSGTKGLKKQINNLSKALEKMNKNMKQGQQNNQQNQQMNMQLNQQLNKMSQYLQQHDMKRKFMKKMNALQQALMMAQMQMRNQGKQGAIPSLGQQQGQNKGKGIGSGTDSTTNKSKTSPKTAGYYTKIKGQKGTGPSDMTLEEAASGKGTSSLSGQRGKQEYKFQLESYIQREDVPGSMKTGVKNYFKSIHPDN
jgi:myosin heavy subunit